MRFVGVPDTFAPTGSEEWLLDYFGISADGIAAAARELVDGRAPVQSLDAPGALSRDRGG
jgi:transketolase